MKPIWYSNYLTMLHSSLISHDFAWTWSKGQNHCKMGDSFLSLKSSDTCNFIWWIDLKAVWLRAPNALKADTNSILIQHCLQWVFPGEIRICAARAHSTTLCVPYRLLAGVQKLKFVNALTVFVAVIEPSPPGFFFADIEILASFPNKIAKSVQFTPGKTELCQNFPIFGLKTTKFVR